MAAKKTTICKHSDTNIHSWGGFGDNNLMYWCTECGALGRGIVIGKNKLGQIVYDGVNWDLPRREKDKK